MERDVIDESTAGQLKCRAAGILLHPASLPGEEGIGTFGKWAFRFIDFLAEAGQSYWQILPLGPTGFANSPYLSFSSRAGNPLLIDLEMGVGEGLGKAVSPLTAVAESERIHYPTLIQRKYPLLRRFWESFQTNASSKWRGLLDDFRAEQEGWLEDYALFMALKKEFNYIPWNQWPEAISLREETALLSWRSKLHREMDFEIFLQFLFYYQWKRILDKAHKKGISIIGDIPLYVSLDSADAWVEPDLFQLDQNLQPVKVSGVPPDYFSEDGQLWGSPVYNWDYHIESGFAWWLERFRSKMALADLFRLDHFRGLESYWAVPYFEKTAREGSWEQAPGRALLQKVRDTYGSLPLIAEDLGDISREVEKLRDDFGLPGMHIMQFGFDGNPRNQHSFHHHRNNAVVYTGTHDNDTLHGWFNGLPEQELRHIEAYLASRDDLPSRIIRLTMMSPARLAIIPMQDYLNLGGNARMNTPGSTDGNWEWRMNARDTTAELAARIRELCTIYGRVQA
jgi:4-alpha-glucanotransferase